MFIKQRAYWLIYFLCILLAGIYCFKRPLYNWDMLPYTAIILNLDHYNAKEAHLLTYKLAQESIPDKYYRNLTDSSHLYRRTMFNDPVSFTEQLPFYVVKPLYIGISYLFYKAGVGLPQATLLPSFISYLLIAFLLFHWLSIYLSMPTAFGIALLIMISSPVISIAKCATPDCLSTFLLLTSFYFIIEKPDLKSAYILMLLSVFARLDNIVTCIIIWGIIFFSKKWNKRVLTRDFLLYSGGFIICYLFIGLLAKHYGWSIFFYNNFADRLHPSFSSGAHSSFKSYVRLMYEQAMGGINYSLLTVFMALLLFYINNPFPVKELSFEKLFALFIPVILLLRFILFPEISDRFYISFYIIILILLVKKITLGELRNDMPTAGI